MIMIMMMISAPIANVTNQTAIIAIIVMLVAIARRVFQNVGTVAQEKKIWMKISTVKIAKSSQTT